MRQQYTDQKFKADTIAIIRKADEILAEYAADNLVVTVRQLYYQFVARDLIPNSQKSYKRLADIIMQGRMSGLLDWDRIEDRGRLPESPSEWSSIDQIVDAAVAQFKLPRLRGQHVYAELWVEKQALAGVLAPLAREFHVTLMVNKGYSSASAMRESALRFERKAKDLQQYTRRRVERVLFYLGDHDPSGEDMVRDIRDRLTTFGVDRLDVRKVALTMGQIEQYEPPPNPAKTTDSRYEKYAAQHGTESWELDALDPPTLRAVIREAFASVVDRAAWDTVIREEEAQRARMKAAVAAMRSESIASGKEDPKTPSLGVLGAIIEDAAMTYGRPFASSYTGAGVVTVIYRRAEGAVWPFGDDIVRVFRAKRVGEEVKYERDERQEQFERSNPISPSERPLGRILDSDDACDAAESMWGIPVSTKRRVGSSVAVIFRREHNDPEDWPFGEDEVRVYLALDNGEGGVEFYRDMGREREESA